MMAQREATQTEAKHKAIEREANKETRRKEKEELAKQVRIQKEERATKKLQREQVEAERRARRGGRQIDVDAGAGEEPAVTGGHGTGAAAVERGAGATSGGAYSPQSAGAFPPRSRNNEIPMLRPLSPPCIFHHHPSSQAMVSTACAPQFHGSPNSPFLFNPVMAMQHMLPHPTG